jgi:hypothetical protein
MFIFISFNIPLLNIVCFRLYKNFFSYNLIQLFHWRFRFRAWLILDTIFNCWCFSQLKTLVGIIKLLLLIVLFWMKIRCALLRMLRGCWFAQLNFGWRVSFESQATSKTGKNRWDLRWVFGGFWCEVLADIIIKFRSITPKSISWHVWTYYNYILFTIWYNWIAWLKKYTIKHLRPILIFRQTLIIFIFYGRNYKNL